MLSKKVKANVLGMLLENYLYSGYCNGLGINNQPAYIISERKIKDDLIGIVIAVLTLKDGQIKAIVAPEGVIYYEPDLINIFSKLKNIEIEAISCLYEKSCGAIVFNKSNNKTKILLVKNHNGRYWSFPKGHMEFGETEKETATREIKEETGLDIKILDGFREVSDYCPFGKVRKRAVFFLGQSDSTKYKIQESEIAQAGWFDFEISKNRCNYLNDIRIIEKAEKIIDNL